MAETTLTVNPELLRTALMTDIYRIIGVAKVGVLRRMADWLMKKPLRIFCNIAAEMDCIIGEEGVPAGATWIVKTWFANDITARGQENIPPEGPLLVVSNHPGGIDSACLAAKLNRKDIKIVASNAPFLRRLPNVSEHLIFIGSDTATRMTVIRQAVRHLETGGALLIFPTGLIDPDPGWMTGAEARLEDWSGSVEIFIRKVPSASLLPVVASDVLHPSFSKNPITRMQSAPWKRQRMAELLQFVDQLLRPGKVRMDPKISFGRPYSLAELEENSQGRRLRDAIIDIERELIGEHQAAFYGR
jgi:hypothetical protein